MFRLIVFGTTSLEYYNQVDSIGSGPTPTQYQVLPEGGALDQYGSQQKHPGVVEYTKSLRLRAATPTELTNLYLGLLQLRGKRDKLYRRVIGSGLIHWKWARLVEVSAKRDYEQAKFQVIQDVELRFESAELFWHGDQTGWNLDSGYFLDDGLYLDAGMSFDLTTNPFTITLGSVSDMGRAPTRSIRIAIYAGDTPMSNLVITRTDGESLQYAGVIPAGGALSIDTGLMQVTMGGADAYVDLILSPVADLAAWFTLQPGDNEIAVDYTGGGTGKGIIFNLSEAWY